LLLTEGPEYAGARWGLVGQVCGWMSFCQKLCIANHQAATL